jgi:hypothetical protein
MVCFHVHHFKKKYKVFLPKHQKINRLIDLISKAQGDTKYSSIIIIIHDFKQDRSTKISGF